MTRSSGIDDGRSEHGSTIDSERLERQPAKSCPDADAAAIRSYGQDHPELIHEDYADDESVNNPLSALCYPVSEAYYHLRDCELDVYCLSWQDIDPEATGTHWYLREPDGGEFIDITLPSEGAVLLPYSSDTRRGFLTGDTPSKRAVTILEAVTDKEWSQ